MSTIAYERPQNREAERMISTIRALAEYEPETFPGWRRRMGRTGDARDIYDPGRTMSTIEDRLSASVRYDAINGDLHERTVCSRQMTEAAIS